MNAAEAVSNLKVMSETQPSPKFLGQTNSDLAFTGKIRHSRQLRGLPGVGHLHSVAAGPDHRVLLPGIAERRLRL